MPIRTLIDLGPVVERAVLVGAAHGGRGAAGRVEEHLAELARLADTAGASVVGRLVQRAAGATPRFFIGPGKVTELKALADAAGATLVIFDDAFIPNELIFMDGETEFAAMLVERFTSYHRRSYVCKSGVGDVLIGAAATVAEYNGVEHASHIRDKLVEMTHLNETIYATGIASSYQSHATKSGAYICDDMLANVCKHHVTKIPYEMGRLAQDLAGGLMVTLPSAADYCHSELGPLLEKYLKGREDVPTEHRRRILRLIENMTLGRNAVGYLTESLHGAGSPQAQRVQIYRQMQLSFKQHLAQQLAGIGVAGSVATDLEEVIDGYFARVFATDEPN